MKKLFVKLPFFIKFILINIYGYYLKKIRFNKRFFKSLNFYLKKDYIEYKDFNKNLLFKQLENNKFYKKEDISKYEIINKEFIKNNYEKIINTNETNSYLYTSGTTGSGLKFPISKEFVENQWAIFWKFRYIHGLTIDSWCAYIIGQSLFQINQKKPPFWFKSYGTKQLIFSQYHLNEKTIFQYINEIKLNNIKWLHAYPSVLNNIANLIKTNNLKENALALKLEIITTSSEKLFEYQKQNIENVFNCKIKELYGLTEGVVNIFECEKNRLHVDESYSYVEFISIPDTKEYKIVGTSYYNKAFPLVRYDTGDTCLLYEDIELCECGRKSRIVKEILGRDEDYIILQNGNKIGRLDHIFKNSVNVKEAQIYQKEKGKAIFKIVKNINYSKRDEDNLKNEIKDKLGNDFSYEIEYLESIIKTKRGKLKFVISEINE